MQTKCLEPLQKLKGRFGSGKAGLSPPPHPYLHTSQVIYYWPFQGSISVVVLLYYMLQYVCLYMVFSNMINYGLQQCGQLNNSCPLCFLFCNVKQKIG